MKKYDRLAILVLPLLIVFSACQKEEPVFVPKEIIKFEVSPDSVKINGFVEIDFESSKSSNVGYSGGWENTGGEFLYLNNFAHSPKYWKAPMEAGEYQLSVTFRSNNKDYYFESTDTVTVVVFK